MNNTTKIFGNSKTSPNHYPLLVVQLFHFLWFQYIKITSLVFQSVTLQILLLRWRLPLPHSAPHISLWIPLNQIHNTSFNTIPFILFLSFHKFRALWILCLNPNLPSTLLPDRSIWEGLSLSLHQVSDDFMLL